jgi:peptidoglycan-N-acetylglucosamine deacetylase
MIKNIYSLLFLPILLMLACKDKNSGSAIKSANDSTQVIVDENGKEKIVPKVVKKALFKPVIDSSKPFVYLTWDDGPNDGTPAVLKLIKEYKIPMSLFLVGRNGAVPGYKKYYDDAAALDHVTFHNHSWSHANGRYKNFYYNLSGVIEDFNKCSALFNFDNSISRGPGRNAWRVNNISVTDIKASTKAFDTLAKSGHNVIGWDVEWNMALRGNAVVPTETADQLIAEIDASLANANTKIPKHCIILAHDQMWTLPADQEQLRLFFDRITKEKKYNLAYIKDYPACAGMTKE